MVLTILSGVLLRLPTVVSPIGIRGIDVIVLILIHQLVWRGDVHKFSRLILQTISEPAGQQILTVIC